MGEVCERDREAQMQSVCRTSQLRFSVSWSDRQVSSSMSSTVAELQSWQEEPFISKSLPRRTHQLSSAIIHLLIPCLQNSIDSIKAYKWTLSKKLPREYVKAEIILSSSQHVYALLAAFFHLHSPLCSNLTISRYFSQSVLNILSVSRDLLSLLLVKLIFPQLIWHKKEACYYSCWL